MHKHVTYSRNEPLVAGTATKIAGNSLAQFLVAHIGVGIILQGSVNCHQETRRTEAATQPMVVSQRTCVPVRCSLWRRKSLKSQRVSTSCRYCTPLTHSWIRRFSCGLFSLMLHST